MTMCHAAQKNKNAGFTLVELIVVLVVLGILASAAVYGISGYIDMTTFNKNQENAVSVFQSAQSAVNHMSENGTLEDWAATVPTIGSPEEYQAENPGTGDTVYDETSFNSFAAGTDNSGRSVHMRYTVSYVPGTSNAQGALIEALIGNDFKATDVFSGLITIEFDIEKYVDSRGRLHYGADVYGVFYDTRRSSWDALSRNNNDAITVPYRDYDYRRYTSLVGYCNTLSSAVDTVAVPGGRILDQILFTLRNGETLDLTWSATSEGKPITGTPSQLHYSFTLYDDYTKTRLCDLVVDENSIFSGTPNQMLSTLDLYTALQFDKDTDFVEGKTDSIVISGTPHTIVYTKEVVTDEHNTTITIYRASFETVAKVYVHTGATAFDYDDLTRDQIQNSLYNFPITVSYEIHDGDGISDRISYTLSLDAMMSRNVIEVDADNSKTLNYDISRLFSTLGTVHNNNFRNVPYNIYATMSASPNTFHDASLSACNDSSDFIATEVMYAKRAYDDPVYLQADGTYSYSATAAAKDGGYAVVNTYFGDLGSGSLGTDNPSGGSAVITSFRHLYNIRMLQAYTYSVNYKISRNLNWYTTTPSGYKSDVRVYSANVGGTALVPASPVPAEYGLSYGSRLGVVSFPAIPSLNSISTLTAGDNPLSSETDKTSIINNVQMRASSFIPANDDGFGLICSNEGSVINIRINGLSLMLANTTDGSLDDMSTIVSSMNNAALFMLTAAADNADLEKPVGGLIGYNKGVLGSGSLTEGNTISLSNCHIMAGTWSGSAWNLYANASSCGGIVGTNENSDPDAVSAYGKIEFTGVSSVIGCSYVGGIIGYNNANVEALLKVDNSLNTGGSLFTPDPGTPTYVIAGREMAVGGAIGYSGAGKHFSQSDPGTTHSVDLYTGVVTMTAGTDPEYAIDVILDQNSRIISRGTTACIGVGGAVGQINNYPGMILSIQVSNEGIILNNSHALGGAVGYINGGTASRMYISAYNSGKIGTENGTAVFGASTTGTGGAIGRIENFGYVTNIIRVSSENEGQVFGKITDDLSEAGVGGAIGSVTATWSVDPIYIVRSDNSGKIYGDTPSTSLATEVAILGNYNLFGVGGAVGLFKYAPHASSVYCVMEENSSVTAGGNNAGGSVGCQRLPMKEEQALAQASTIAPTYTTFSADLCSGAEVTAGAYNAGGAAGNLCDLNSNTRLIARVMNGEVKVSSVGNTGGVAGRFVQTNSIGSAGSFLLLVGNDSTPTLTVRSCNASATEPAAGNENAGGLAGLSGSTVDFEVALVMPTQQDTNLLNIKVESYDNAGGMVGQMRGNLDGGSNKNLTIPTLFLTLNSGSYVKAFGSNAGGAIGLLKNINTLSSSLMFSSETGTSVSAVTGNCGGCIGNAESTTAFNIVGNILTSGTLISLEGGANVGGCIGKAESDKNFSITGTITTTGTSIGIKGTDNVGGCMGRIVFSQNTDSTIINAPVTYECHDSFIEGNDNVGGVIGTAYKGYYKNNIEYKGYNCTIKGHDNVGGVIGYSVQVLSDKPLLASTYEQFTLEGNNNVGGILGYLEGIYPSDQNKNWIHGMTITINGNASISGTGYVAGTTGYIMKSQYSQSGLVLASGASLSITSSAGAAGGIIGGMQDMIIGPGGGDIRVTCNNGSALSITGSTCAGGIVGYNTGKINAKEIGFTLSSGAVVNITSTAAGSGAGGFIGIIGNNNDSNNNNYALARTKNRNTTLCNNNNGTINIRSDNGYAGGIVGINYGILGDINNNWTPKVSDNPTLSFIVPANVNIYGTAYDRVVGLNNTAHPTWENYKVG